MEKNVIKALIKQHEELASTYRQAADTACSAGQAHDVYMHIKDSMYHETRARNLRNRYGHVLMETR